MRDLKRYISDLEKAATKNWEVAIAITDDKSLAAEELANLAKHHNEQVRAGVAAHKNTSGDTLAVLAKDGSYDVVFDVSDNEHTPSDTLAMLAKHEDYNIRKNVAMATKTPATLSLLAHDEDRVVRMHTADNPYTHWRDRLDLINDKDKLVWKSAVERAPFERRAELAGDSTTSPEVLARLILADEREWVVRNLVAHNPNTSADTLRLLAKDREELVRQAAVQTIVEQECRKIFTKIDKLTTDTEAAMDFYVYVNKNDVPTVKIPENVRQEFSDAKKDIGAAMAEKQQELERKFGIPASASRGMIGDFVRTKMLEHQSVMRIAIGENILKSVSGIASRISIIRRMHPSTIPTRLGGVDLTTEQQNDLKNDKSITIYNAKNKNGTITPKVIVSLNRETGRIRVVAAEKPKYQAVQPKQHKPSKGVKV